MIKTEFSQDDNGKFILSDPCVITGDYLPELIDYCLRGIRERSKEYYRKELEKDLLEKGESLIDRNAGMGTAYKVILLDYQHQHQIKPNCYYRALSEIVRECDLKTIVEKGEIFLVTGVDDQHYPLFIQIEIKRVGIEKSSTLEIADVKNNPPYKLIELIN